MEERRPTSQELFTPKLVTVLREGYGAAQLRADLLAGLTVAVVALPLSMAIAVASGVSPDRGLWTAIVGGFLVSAFGGSRHQIGGPAGAFIVLVSATVMQHGVEGLILATFLSGLMLVAAGWLRLGGFVKVIPYPVTIGFTAGIAVIIFASQIVPLLGLTLGEPEPGPILPKLNALAGALPTANPAAIAVAAGTVAIVLGVRQLRPGWPGMLLAICATALATWALALPVATIGSQFGGIPSAIPAPGLPRLSADLVLAVLPNALSFALLGAIESLLSAVVADSMTGRRHRSNCELVAQGIGNIGAALFGGFCVTGTIARTATNVRAGAHGPVAGMIHALALLALVLLIAPLASYIPLASLAGVLVIVAFNMSDHAAFGALLRGPRGDAVVLLTTFLLTVFRDLTEGIIAGFALGSAVFIRRMSKQTEVVGAAPLVTSDMADVPHPGLGATDPEIIVQHVRGALFFGAVSILDSVLARIGARHRVLVLDLSEVPFLDASGVHAIRSLGERAHREGLAFYVTGLTPADRAELGTRTLHGAPLRHAPTPSGAAADWKAGGG